MNLPQQPQGNPRRRAWRRALIPGVLGLLLCGDARATPPGADATSIYTTSAHTTTTTTSAHTTSAHTTATSAYGPRADIRAEIPNAARPFCSIESCGPRPGDSPWTRAGFGAAILGAGWLGRRRSSGAREGKVRA